MVGTEGRELTVTLAEGIVKLPAHDGSMSETKEINVYVVVEDGFTATLNEPAEERVSVKVEMPFEYTNVKGPFPTMSIFKLIVSDAQISLSLKEILALGASVLIIVALPVTEQAPVETVTE